jgi:hypothetical protein
MFYSYGHFLRYKHFENKIENLNDRSILGCILLSFLALILNFFLPLNREINTLLLISGVILMFIKRKNSFQKKEFFYIILTSVITSSLILYSNVNRPDAGLYHLPYVSFLNENKIIIGLSNIHFRFGVVSIIQYLSAINNNLIFKNIGIVIPLASIVTYFVIYFFNKVLKIIKNIENISHANIFALFIVVFISYKINRYSSFGNDAVAHLSLFYLLSKLLEKNKVELSFVSLIAVFAFMNKTTLVLALLIPLYLFLKNISLKNIKVFYSFSSIFLICWIVKNLMITGCIVYPIKQSCFKNLNWTDIKEVKIESLSGEVWSKDWSNRIDKNISMKDYNKKFNWISSWSKNHGIIMLKIVVPYFLVCFIIIYLIKKKETSKKVVLISKNKNLNFFIFFSFVGIFLFIIKFPLYRYGYSYLISFIILMINFIFWKFDKKNLIKTTKIVLIFCIIIFFGKQLQRYIKNYNSNYLWPRIYSFQTNQKIDLKKIFFNENFIIYKSEDVCMYNNSPCTNYDLKKNLSIVKKYSYYFVNIKN